MSRLELVAASRHVERAREVAESLHGALLCDERDVEGLPFRALVAAVTDDLESLLPAADVGAYLACRRVIKRRAATAVSGSPAGGPSAGMAAAPAAGMRLPGATALYPMVRRRDLTHQEADRHWRDRHAPLALRHHPAMSHYDQLSVVHRLHGPEWDGFALCGFDSIDDLEHRFFADEEARRVIRHDVSLFADGERSPRRLIAIATSFGHLLDDRG